jgi:hypothetical protein
MRYWTRGRRSWLAVFGLLHFRTAKIIVTVCQSPQRRDGTGGIPANGGTEERAEIACEMAAGLRGETDYASAEEIAGIGAGSRPHVTASLAVKKASRRHSPNIAAHESGPC